MPFSWTTGLVPPKKQNACARRATCRAEGKEFLPMIAVHITKKAGYDAIVKAREIRPQGRKRRHGESGWGFETDFLAGDAKYVFLSLGEKYQYETMNETRYFFAFDVHRLISDFDVLVGPDLANDYDAIVNVIIEETNALPEQFNPI